MNLKKKPIIMLNRQNLIRYPSKTKKRNSHEESNLQITCCQLACHLKSGFDSCIGSRVIDHLHANANGGKRNVREAARMKKEGVKAGVSDLFLSIAKPPYHGLWLELKIGKNKLTDLQKQWFEKKIATGYAVAVIKSVEEFKKVVENYLNEKHQFKINENNG